MRLVVKKDPVCGRQVTHEKFRVTYKRVEYFFCSMQCESTFKREPDRFAKKGELA
ncbi:hypothetical protein B9Q11_02510 [Candidatus Marsarchaeota G2 archaeon ECH_B_SAG-F08]|uniref:TRASH domain-containing protein n=5 Tax=Candidatus Marsarchaeota TaxID=1978152 RepID=A0A2R6BI06_9ARCH|nr:MAG: hypothetical protein B9Q01_02830 [Candidatus Marsarchaeota G1 archaeon OSP_D]PSN88406.1 MAG: hypothetical protein B9Q00_05535 [Candidatus Marsarchaeota G1 archaeon OSP_C]PSN96517.1 MAG: hypothetical protein B9P99_00310 [Candidatus Marsarchaeota G1 archaeon OSP_B]PSN98274.1 MAG: hypothetical protein B9Q11_02510 [Candidatus Marsarchaeota G2 archaeon ECH_B_SAG-F08]PSO02273.1 MAG: hypothetical protein B9Q10_01490 [Candidatus Marsarchaeota G2 archaeon ECH_B_SAG-E12]